MRKSKILWKPKPKNIDRSQLTKFIKFVNEDLNLNIPRKYNSIWNWSVINSAEFWNKIWDFNGVIGQKGSRVLIDSDLMPGAKFFPDAMLNYAENLLKGSENSIAIISNREDGLFIYDLSDMSELYANNNIEYYHPV